VNRHMSLYGLLEARRAPSAASPSAHRPPRPRPRASSTPRAPSRLPVLGGRGRDDVTKRSRDQDTAVRRRQRDRARGYCVRLGPSTETELVGNRFTSEDPTLLVPGPACRRRIRPRRRRAYGHSHRRTHDEQVDGGMLTPDGNDSAPCQRRAALASMAGLSTRVGSECPGARGEIVE